MSFVETFVNRMPNKLPVHIHSLGKKTVFHHCKGWFIIMAVKQFISSSLQKTEDRKNIKQKKTKAIIFQLPWHRNWWERKPQVWHILQRGTLLLCCWYPASLKPFFLSAGIFAKDLIHSRSSVRQTWKASPIFLICHQFRCLLLLCNSRACHQTQKAPKSGPGQADITSP